MVWRLSGLEGEGAGPAQEVPGRARLGLVSGYSKRSPEGVLDGGKEAHSLANTQGIKST